VRRGSEPLEQRLQHGVILPQGDNRRR
jgi:hypothetical protein